MAVQPVLKISICDVVDPSGRINRCPVCSGEVNWYPSGAVAANREICDCCKEIEITTDWGFEG